MTLKTTYQQSQPAWPLRALNRLGRGLENSGVSVVDLSEAALMQAAVRRVGLTDWGDDSFRSGLRTLLEAYHNDVRLNLVGRLRIRRECVRLLSNRLLIQDCLKRHPEIAEIPIQRPLIIFGLPRTGTTLLQRTLARDPASRVLRLWEGIFPAPLPGEHPGQPAPRIKQTRQQLQLFRWFAPNLTTTVHPMEATSPEECMHLIQHSFAAYVTFELNGNLTSYTTWLDSQDMVPAYRYFRQILQLLQWQQPGRRWVLKAPSHLFALKALLQVFPDACLVQTHRDPIEVIPSVCSLFAILWRAHSDRINLAQVGQKVTERLVIALERTMAGREAANSAQFYDVQYNTLTQAPLETVQRIYAHFGYPGDDQAVQSMAAWLATNPRHKYGVHRYSAEQFGLNTADLKHRFATYCHRFLTGT